MTVKEKQTSSGSPVYNRSCPSVLTVKPRANGRGIVGQQLPTLLDVTCRARQHTPLHVVTCCWEMLRKVRNRSNFEPTTPNISFDQWLPKYIMVRLHSSSNSAGATRTRITNGLLSLLGQILPTMQCSSQQSSVCIPLPTRTQQLPTLTPNIVGPLLAQLHRHPFTGL